MSDAKSDTQRIRDLKDELRKKDQEIAALKSALADHELSSGLKQYGISPSLTLAAKALLRDEATVVSSATSAS